MIYAINIVIFVSIAIAIYQTMDFIVELGNAIIGAMKSEDENAYLDNRHLLSSWLLVLVCLFVKSVTL